MKHIPSELQTITADIIPHNKTKSADNNQRHDHQIYNPVIIIIYQRAVLPLPSHQIKTGIAESGDGVEYPIINSPSHSQLGNEPQSQQNRPGSLKNHSSQNNLPGQSYHSANLKRVDAFLHQSPLLQSDFSSQNNGEKNADGDKSKTANLNHGKDYQLAKDRPVGPGIINNQTCHAGSAGCCKQAFQKRSRRSAFAGNRQHQKQASYQDNPHKSIGDILSLGQMAVQTEQFFLNNIHIPSTHPSFIFFTAAKSRNAARFTRTTLAPAGVENP